MTRRTDKPTTCRLERIVSGGQTGVDRAALDVALERGLPCGGWCPRGRLAEDGVIPSRYPLTEALTTSYSNRTELNVRDSDATLIVVHGPLRGGTALTKRQAEKLGRPVLVVDPLVAGTIELAAEWIVTRRVKTLNIAGPRASSGRGVHSQATKFLRTLLERLAFDQKPPRSARSPRGSRAASCESRIG